MMKMLVLWEMEGTRKPASTLSLKSDRGCGGLNPSPTLIPSPDDLSRSFSAILRRIGAEHI